MIESPANVRGFFISKPVIPLCTIPGLCAAAMRVYMTI